MTRASNERDLEKRIKEILGVSAQTSLDSPLLEKARRAELLEIGRLLGLRGTSRLRKREIVERILEALSAAPGGPEEPEEKEEKEEKIEKPREPSPPPAPPVAERGFRQAEFQARKFSLEEPTGAPPPLPKHIPWGYGRTRVGALPVDPDRLFVYWEVTDDAVEGAREELGPAGKDAWLNLRVYDTTGRLFDGTNARSYFDQAVGTNPRQWFFDVAKPGSEAFVEIGLRCPDGRFRRLARSGRVAFPRREPAPYRETEWLTVRASSGGGAVVTVPETSPSLGRGITTTPPTELLSPGTGPEETWQTFEEDTETSTWESEPFSIPLDVPEPVWETYPGEPRTFQVDGRTHVVFGPWQVVVRGIGAHGGRRILSRWEVYRSWAVEGIEEPASTGVWRRMMESSALLGGSERLFRAASELRFSGASEILYGGASERRLGGASERVYAGASERRMRGASERRFRGASERRLGGASERSPFRSRRTTPDERGRP